MPARECRRAERNRMQEAYRVRNQRGVDADPCNQGGTAEMHAEAEREAEHEREPDRLVEQRPDRFAPAGAGELRDRRRQRHHHADHRVQGERPDACADRIRAERVRIEMAGEQHVDQVHADRGQLAEHERHREAQRLSQLACETRPVAM